MGAVVALAILGWAALASTPRGGSGPSTAVAFGGRDVATMAPAPSHRANARPSAPQSGSSPSAEPAAQPPTLLTGYRWPVEHARITNAFGAGRPGNETIDGQVAHDGIDISSFCGGHVVAAHDGVVLASGRHYEAYVGWVGDLAPYRERLDSEHAWGHLAIAVVVDDGNGYRSIYLHLNLATVKAGDVVRAGQMLGYQGSTGAATGCHLHYALFSPLEKRTFGIDPKVVKKTKLPAAKTARIDPLLVLPPLADGFITWGWGAGGPT